MYGLAVYTGPTSEPVSLAEARAHCRIDTVDDDAILAGLILAARQYVEAVTGRAILSQTFDLTLDDFPAWEIELPRSPVASITSIGYLDTAGVSKTVTSYVLDGRSRPPRLTPAYGESWPETRGTAGCVTVRFVAGESQAPEPLRQAILLLVGSWYENREDTVIASGVSVADLPHGVSALLAPYRVW